jgi:hypothetical protein
LVLKPAWETPAIHTSWEEVFSDVPGLVRPLAAANEVTGAIPAVRAVF